VYTVNQVVSLIHRTEKIIVHRELRSKTSELEYCKEWQKCVMMVCEEVVVAVASGKTET